MSDTRKRTKYICIYIYTRCWVFPSTPHNFSVPLFVTLIYLLPLHFLLTCRLKGTSLPVRISTSCAWIASVFAMRRNNENLYSTLKPPLFLLSFIVTCGRNKRGNGERGSTVGIRERRCHSQSRKPPFPFLFFFLSKL